VSRFAFVAAERANHAVATLCRVVGASVSGFYAWLRAIPATRARAEAEAELRGLIGRIFAARRRAYGSRRVHAELRREGRRHSRRRVERLMREMGLQARRGRRRPPRTTDSRHDLPVAPNLLDRNFAADRPDTVWLADISYLPTGEGWLYLAAVEDLATREIPPVPLRGPEGRLRLEHGRSPQGRAVRGRAGHGPAAPPAGARPGPPQRPRGAARVQAVVATPA
jgi:putative transposase